MGRWHLPEESVDRKTELLESVEPPGQGLHGHRLTSSILCSHSVGSDTSHCGCHWLTSFRLCSHSVVSDTSHCGCHWLTSFRLCSHSVGSETSHCVCHWLTHSLYSGRSLSKWIISHNCTLWQNSNYVYSFNWSSCQNAVSLRNRSCHQFHSKSITRCVIQINLLTCIIWKLCFFAQSWDSTRSASVSYSHNSVSNNFHLKK